MDESRPANDDAIATDEAVTSPPGAVIREGPVGEMVATGLRTEATGVEPATADHACVGAAVPSGPTVSAPPLRGMGARDPTPAAAARGRPALPGYEILAELGRGGMGVVYRARQTRLNRPCALKMILAGDHAAPEATARFLAEAQAVARLNHPGIVQIHSLGEWDGRPYIELEFIAGGSLADRLDGTPWPPRRAAELVEAMARAMAEAHQLGVVHRDLKPANVLLAADGAPKITDFGLAKSLGADSGLTRTDSVMGTPSYMAPEQAGGKTKDVGPAADVYALGAIFYELLTGRPPFKGATVLETLEQVKTAEPVPPRRLVPGTARDVETVALKCLRKDPARRYATAAALAEDLRRFQAGEPIAVRPVGAVERGWLWCRRNPVVAALTALAAVLLLAVAAVASVGYLQTAAALRVANRNLYLSLVGEARALRLARVIGYREQAWSRLRSALRIETPVRDIDLMRHEAVACLGDFAGFAPREFPRLPARVTALALHPRDDLMALGLIDGTLLLCRRTSGAEVARLPEHQGEIASVTFGPDGNTLVSGDRVGTIKVWERKGGEDWRCRKTLPAAWKIASLRGWEIASLVVTPGNLLAASSSGSKIAMWDLADPNLAPAPGLEAGSPGQSLPYLALSPDGKLMAAGFQDPRGELRLIVWDVATRRVRQSMQVRIAPNLLAFSPDSSRLAVHYDGSGHFILDAGTLEPQGPRVPSGEMRSIAFSPDGQFFAVATSFGRVSLWRAATNDEVAVFNHPDSSGGVMGRRVHVAFSPDGQSLLAAGGQTVLSWGLATAAERRVLYGPEALVEGLAFGPDGRVLAVAHWPRDDLSGTLTLRDASTGRTLNQVTGLGSPRWAAFSPDGTLLATCDGGALKVRGVPSLREVTASSPLGDDKEGCAEFSPDGSLVAACGGDALGVWSLGQHGSGRDARSGLSLERIGRVPGSNSPYLCFSPDGKRIAWVDGFQTVKLWDVTRRCEIRFGGPALLAGWQSLAFLRDGRQLVMITQDRAAEVWDVDAGRRAFTLGEAGEFAKSHVALSRDGRWFAGDHTTSAVAVWDLERRRRLFVLPEERGSISHTTWSPDGTRLAIGMKDGRVILWDLPQVRAQLAGLGLDW